MTDTSLFRGYGRTVQPYDAVDASDPGRPAADPAGGVADADRVLTRLERIDVLRERGGGGEALLGELRALVGEAEVWARAEGDARARAAAAKLRERTEGMR